MADFGKADFGVFYSDFATPATVAGVAGFTVLYTHQELEMSDSYGSFPVMRAYQKFNEGDTVVMNPDTLHAENYTIKAIKSLDYNEWLHVLQDA